MAAVPLSPFKWGFAIVYFPVQTAFYAVDVKKVPFIRGIVNQMTLNDETRSKSHQGHLTMYDQLARWFLFSRVIHGYSIESARGIAKALTRKLRYNGENINYAARAKSNEKLLKNSNNN